MPVAATALILIALGLLAAPHEEKPVTLDEIDSIVGVDHAPPGKTK